MSIAIQLLSNPQLLLLDEPTRHLDSFTSYYIMSALKNLAEQGSVCFALLSPLLPAHESCSTGKTVICTVHQPSAHMYEMFDDVLLLSKGMFAPSRLAQARLLTKRVQETSCILAPEVER